MPELEADRRRRADPRRRSIAPQPHAKEPTRMFARAFSSTLARHALCALAIVVAVAPANAASGRRITIPNATPIRVEVTKTLLPKTSEANETFEIRAVDDVVVDGYVVVKKGATGQGTITETASHKLTQVLGGIFHHTGVVGLRIRFDWIYAVDGEKIRVAYLTTDGTPEGSNPPVASPAPDYATTTSASTSGVATGAIPTVQTFTTYVLDTVHVVSHIASSGAVENESGFAH
jgi:hypothetical protein